MAKVLVVDDNPVDRALIAAVLRKRGDEVKELSGAGLVEEIARSARPDLILMDVVMEGQDGFAVCRRLKKDPDTRDIPIVLVSARTSENDQFWGKRNGAVAYVCKPASPDDLNAAIDFALSSHVQSSSSPWRSWAIPSGLNYRGSTGPESAGRRPPAAPLDPKAPAARQGTPAAKPAQDACESTAGRATAAAIEAFRTASMAFRKKAD